MLDFTDAQIVDLIIHKVGSQAENELQLSHKQIPIDEDLDRVLRLFFLEGMKTDELFRFHHDSALDLNEVFTYSRKLFGQETTFLPASVELARHLFNCSTHHNIKYGEFYVIRFKGISFKGVEVEALGLFKSETKDTFLQVYPQEEGFGLDYQQGISLNKLDKSALILSTEEQDGYVIAVQDRTNKGSDAHYWKDLFLQVTSRQDSYFHTRQYLDICREFVKNGMPEAEKADQVDLINRSVDFFKERESFDRDTFQQEVIQEPELIQSFESFKQDYKEQQQLDTLVEEFDISTPAVKKSSRYIRSVIKLDKDFHVYVHGNREKIERGFDPDRGLSYYKIYFKEEH